MIQKKYLKKQLCEVQIHIIAFTKNLQAFFSYFLYYYWYWFIFSLNHVNMIEIEKENWFFLQINKQVVRSNIQLK